MATDSTAINPASDNMSRSDSSRALAVKSPQYLQLTNKAGTQSEYIRDGWSWGGFSFGVFWLVRHRVWSSILLSLLALIGGGLAILASVKYLGTTEFVKSIAALSVAALLLIHLFLGGRGNFWRQATLVGRGWIPVRKIFAKNVDEAMEVGESALADLPVHRAPEMGAGSSNGEAEGKPNLPELRPLLKTGEPEIRTVRRPESQSETSAATPAQDTAPTSGTAKTDSNELAAKSRLDEDTNSTWKVASQRISKSDTDEAGRDSADAATAASFDDKSDKNDPVVSDTSRFDAPAPVLKSTNTSPAKVADADKVDPVRNTAAVKTESSESIVATKSTMDMAAAATASKTAASTTQSISERGEDRLDASDEPVDSTDRREENRFGNAPSQSDDEDGKESAVRKRPTFSGSPEAMFERTLGGPRNRSTPVQPAEASADSVTRLRDTQTASNTSGKEADTAGKSMHSAGQRQPQKPRTASTEQEQERVRLEPTLRPQAPKAPPAPLTTATTTTRATPDQDRADVDSRRKNENENNELFEVAWNEIESGKMISALEARALTQHPDNTDQRKALYIRMRVAQLREERLLAREEATAARRRRAQRIAELEREEVYRDFVQIVQPNHASLRHAKPTLANFARSTDADSDLSLKVLNDAVESIGMTVVFAPMAGYVAECKDGQMLELGNREQLNEFLLVLMNSDRTVSSGGSSNASNGSGPTTGHPNNPG